MGNSHHHILDAYRIYCKQDPLHDGNASQTIAHEQNEGEGHFFGLSKSDLAGDKPDLRHLSVRCGHSEQSLGAISSYTRGQMVE